MNFDEALRVLKLTGNEDMTAIKRQYRRLMGQFHPDAIGSDRPEHIHQAQRINEAYGFLKDYDKNDRKTAGTKSADKFNRRSAGTGHQSRKSRQKEQHTTWQGMMNASAFCDRHIYQYYNLDDEEAEKMYYQAAVGKYMWQPENEEFALFIMSIHHAVKALMEGVENRAECLRLDREAVRSKQFEVRAHLFHLLAQQFVNPIHVLKCLSKPVKYDKDGRGIWHFRAWIGTRSRDSIFQQMRCLKQGELLYPKSFAGSKILVRNKEGQELGHLSFEDDWIYLCVIPLLKQKKAQVRMVTAGVEVRKGTRPYAVKADIDFYLRVEKDAVEYSPPADLNLKIADLLLKYELYCSALV